jgi:hypothetical protein
MSYLVVWILLILDSCTVPSWSKNGQDVKTFKHSGITFQGIVLYDWTTGSKYVKSKRPLPNPGIK